MTPDLLRLQLAIKLFSFGAAPSFSGGTHRAQRADGRNLSAATGSHVFKRRNSADLFGSVIPAPDYHVINQLAGCSASRVELHVIQDAGSRRPDGAGSNCSSLCLFEIAPSVTAISPKRYPQAALLGVLHYSVPVQRRANHYRRRI